VRERHGLPEDSVFPSIRGEKLSRDEIERLITKYTHLAAQTCPRSKGSEYLRMSVVSPQPWTFFNMLLIAL
jgi:hypothetical protein